MGDSGGEKMGSSIERRKRIGKILVLLLASGSLLGISPLTATAAPGDPTVEITVEVTDSTPEPTPDPTPPECTPAPAPAIWAPALMTSATNVFDLFTTPPSTGTFTVDLNFMAGYDPGCEVAYPVTGTVLSTWASTSSPQLTLSSLDCEFGCDAFLSAPAGAGGQIEGEYRIPNEVGTAIGTLTITWTPDS